MRVRFWLWTKLNFAYGFCRSPRSLAREARRARPGMRFSFSQNESPGGSDQRAGATIDFGRAHPAPTCPIWARVVTARRGMHRFLPRLNASACRTDM